MDVTGGGRLTSPAAQSSNMVPIGHNIIHMQSSIVSLDLRVIPSSKEMGSTLVLSGANHRQSEGNQSVYFTSH